NYIFYSYSFLFFFFFSSRRRHTRSYGDWSSDVCSSDLRIERRPRLVAAQACGRRSEGSPCSRLSAASRLSRRCERGAANVSAVRSEERRVGKECRCRWWVSDGRRRVAV